jgi:hypothetical protein
MAQDRQDTLIAMPDSIIAVLSIYANNISFII